MKKALALILVCVMLASVFAGCGSKAAEPAATEAPKAAEALPPPRFR